MDLIHPERLLVLLLVPLLWWLARPPRPRIAVITAHLQQWRAALGRLRRRPIRFRRLRFWLLVLALLAIGSAAAGPRVGVRSGPRELAVLLDVTASMGAREEAGDSALERAVVRLREGLESWPPGVTVRVLAVGDRLRLFSGERAEIAADLAALTPSGATALDLAEMADRLVSPGSAVWTLTDGRDRAPGGGALAILGADELPNAGIVHVDVVDTWPLPEVELRVHVVGASRFRIAVEGGAEVERPLELGGAADDGVVVAGLGLRRAAGGAVTLTLEHDGDDALVADDVARIDLAPPPAPSIAVFTAPDGGQWLRRAAAALAELGGGQVTDTAHTGEEVGFLLADGGRMPAGAGRAMTFGTAVAGPAVWSTGGAPVDWDRQHELTRRLDLSELRVGRVFDPSALPEDGVPLMLGPTGPWMVAVVRDGHRAVHAAFRLDDANLALLPAFPQLLRRAFAWCYGAGARAAFDPSSLPGASESALRRAPSGEDPERPLPPFGDDGLSLTVPLLALAFLLLGGRLYA